VSHEKNDSGPLAHRLNRRRLLAAGAVAGAIPALNQLGLGGAIADDSTGAAGHGGGTSPVAVPHGGGAEGPTFRKGETVDHIANGFNPTDMLRDFDWGKTRRLASGRVLREWELHAIDQDVEVAPGVVYPAWTYNGRVPGPTLRCREGERLRITFGNGSAHPHTIHFHGLHPAAMDGVAGIGSGIIEPGGTAVYEFDAEPFGMHLYHCHAAPLAEHIARGLYGAFIIDPKEGRPEADELLMLMNGFNTNFDAQGNQIYAVNTVAFHYVNEPVKVPCGRPVRIYLGNLLEYDPVNSFHVHGNFFNHFPTGTSLEPIEFTDIVSQVQGQRGILEMEFPFPGHFMFHAHKSEFAELGWMGFFEAGGEEAKLASPGAFCDFDSLWGKTGAK
jgi:FtsP/CotA-like multicopper oxidase with cupredoxin domain